MALGIKNLSALKMSNGQVFRFVVVSLLSGLHYRIPTDVCPQAPSESDVKPTVLEKVKKKDVNGGNVCFGGMCIGNWTEGWLMSLVGGRRVLAGAVVAHRLQSLSALALSSTRWPTGYFASQAVELWCSLLARAGTGTSD